MSVRSCLLCGRPLGRFAGAGEEFCSREHRNQYRLRRSMDRLQEANKVASVMRRRESPRPLTGSKLVNGGPREPRGFAEARPLAQPQPAAVPRISPRLRPRLDAAGAVALANARIGGASQTVCPAPPALRSAAAPLRPSFSMRAPEPQAAPPRGLGSTRALAARAGGDQKLLDGPRPGATLPAPARHPRRIRPDQLRPFEGQARPNSLRKMTAAEGRALRVLLAAGFRIPARQTPQLEFAGPVLAGLRWPGLHELGIEPYQPGERPLAPLVPPDAAIAPPEMRVPAAPPADFQGVFHWPGAMEIPLKFSDYAVRHRAGAVPFTPNEESVQEHPYEYRN